MRYSRLASATLIESRKWSLRLLIERSLLLGVVKINQPFFAPINNRLEDVLVIGCHFELIEGIKLTFETRLDGCVISVDNKLRDDTIEMVINENLKQCRNKDSWELF